MKKLFCTATFIVCFNAFGQIGIQTSSPLGAFHVDAAKDNPASGPLNAAQKSNDFIISKEGSVGVGTTTPHSSAILDLSDVFDKGLALPRVALANNTDQSAIGGSAVNGLMMFNNNANATNLKRGIVYWMDGAWRQLTYSNEGAGGNVSIGVGETVSKSYVVPAAAANSSSFNLGTYISNNSLSPLPIVDGIEASLQGYDASFYRPRIYNRAGSSQTISYQTFATQVNENKTDLNVTISPNSFEGVDSNDIVYWTTSLAEVITTNVQVKVNATTYRWYEIKWWCMQVASEKIIFISILRKL